MKSSIEISTAANLGLSTMTMHGGNMAAKTGNAILFPVLEARLSLPFVGHYCNHLEHCL